MLLPALRVASQSDTRYLDRHYVDQSVTLSDNPMTGTARFRSLGGAMSALGGDMSAAALNPAGLAVFLKPEVSLTAGLNSYYNRAGFYQDNGYTSTSDKINFNFNQLGFVFDLGVSGKSSVKRLAFAVNYQRSADYGRDLYIDASKTSPFTFEMKRIDQTTQKMQFDGYRRMLSGSKDVINFMGAAKFKRRLYVGVSINAHSISYSNTFTGYELEINPSDGGASQTISTKTDEHTSGEGLSASVGVLYKTPFKLRIGLSYTSPQWYDMREDFIDMDTHAPAYSKYDIKTFDRWTLGAAYVFGRSGFIDVDYAYKGYSSSRLGPSGIFVKENGMITTLTHSTSNLHIGIEKRLQYVSFRLGGRWEQSPYIGKPGRLAIGDLWGGAAGIGYRLPSGLMVDLSYDCQGRQRDYGIFYGNPQTVLGNPAHLQTRQSNVLLSLHYAF